MNRTLRNLLFGLSFIVFFIFFFVWTLPYEALQGRVMGQLEDTLNSSLGKNYRIKAKDVNLSFFTGLTLKQVEWTERNTATDSPLLKVSRLRVNPRLFASLFGSTSASFFMESEKGEMSGSIKDSKNSTSLSIDLDEFPMSTLAALAGVNMKGILSGEIELEINKSNPSKTVADINLQPSDVSLTNVSIPLDSRNPSSALSFDEIKIAAKKGSEIQLNLKDNNLKFIQFKFNGDDLQLYNVKGGLTLNKNLAQSSAQISGNIKFNNDLAQKIPIYPLIEPQKLEDGSFNFALNGPLTSKPRYPSLDFGKFTDILNQLMAAPVN